MQVYSATFVAVAVSAVQDLFEIVAPSTKAIEILSVRLGQSSDAGDAAGGAAHRPAFFLVEFSRAFTVSRSVGSAVTPTPLEKGLAAAGATVEANNTTVANTGTTNTPLADTFNVQVGYQYVPVPEERIFLSPSERLVIRLPAAPADALTMSGTLVFREIGG